MRISHEHKLIFISHPKSGSHSGFEMMENYFNAVSYGSFHSIEIPKDCEDYKVISFVRHPYSRAAAIYNLLSQPGIGDDIMRMINHEYYKEEISDQSFQAFCSWLVNGYDDSMISECRETQYDRLIHIPKVTIIKIEDITSNKLAIQDGNDKFHTVKVFHKQKEIHPSFEELYNNSCLIYVEHWGKKDFLHYGYSKCH